jgi:cobalt-zinc-cadmium efflux system protein
MKDKRHHNHYSPERTVGERQLAIALIITAVYMVVEAVGGLLFNSLALLADAGHMLSDAMALGLSWVAIKVGKRTPTDMHTFGFRRSEILAALFNGLSLWAIVLIIGYEAFHRFFNPKPVAGTGMLIIAVIGLLVNLIMAGLLFKTREENLNLKGAFLHVISDALGSVGAITAALFILALGLYWVDPLVSVFICILILYSSWGLVKESVHILMEGVPMGLKVEEVEGAILALGGVCCVYDLHIWSIASDRVALSAHVVLSEPCKDYHELLKSLNEKLREEFDITHTTFQIEISHEMRIENGMPVCRAGTLCNTIH